MDEYNQKLKEQIMEKVGSQITRLVFGLFGLVILAHNPLYANPKLRAVKMAAKALEQQADNDDMAKRCPRQDLSETTVKAQPPTPADNNSAELAEIKKCVCELKKLIQELIIIEDDCCAEIISRLEVLSSQLEECCEDIQEVIGELTDQGVCFVSPLSSLDGIQDSQLTIIQWLKTIMLELRGCGCTSSLDGLICP